MMKKKKVTKREEKKEKNKGNIKEYKEGKRVEWRERKYDVEE